MKEATGFLLYGLYLTLSITEMPTLQSGNTEHPWWCHQMETFSSLLALCAVNSPVTGEFPAQSPMTRSFDVFFDLRMNKRLSKQSWGGWFETPSRPLWRDCNDSLNYRFWSQNTGQNFRTSENTDFVCRIHNTIQKKLLCQTVIF